MWDEKTKKQVDYENRDDGIFFMSDIDFFNCYQCIEICNIFPDSKHISYTIEGKENIRNGIVFNIITEKEGALYVSVFRKHWRMHPELYDKYLPTHISIVKYDPNQTNRLKVFSDYNGTFEPYETYGKC